MQFDQDCITYTQEGRLLQLEYAAKAVETAEYLVLYPEPSSESSARMESSSEQKNKSSPNYWSNAPTDASLISITPSAWSSAGKYQTEGIS